MEDLRILKRVLITAILFLVAIDPAQSKEPTYDGKTLSIWLSELNIRPVGDESQWEKWGPGGKRSRDEAAIRQIGTNGIPTLLNILSINESNKRRVLSKIESKRLKEEFRGKDAALADLRQLAVEGFGILGTNATPAIPQLTKLLHKSDVSRYEVAQVLNRIGPEGFAVLTNELNDRDPAVHNNILWVLGQEGSGDPKLITQLLIEALKDPDPINRGNAARFLAHRDPDVAIPALIPLLNINEHAALDAATALSSYGPAAKSAAPKLLSFYTNRPNVIVFSSLKAIDVDTAAKAEAFVVASGPLNGARHGYTRTKMPNGKELIAGGYIHTEVPTVSNRFLANAELYDSTTGKWVETGEMTTARWSHSAVLLRNGKVLIVGGSSQNQLDSTNAELYDPATGRWTPTASLNHTHRSGQATLQRDGKVRIPGGWDGFKITDDELYDPATEKWTVIPKK